MELALLVQLVLLQLQLTPQNGAGNTAATNAAAHNSDHEQVTKREAKGDSMHGCCTSWMPGWLPVAVRRWAADVAVFGLGAGGCSRQVEQWCCSGDPQRLLPRANLLRLVGFKVPAEAWWVDVAATAPTAAEPGVTGCL